MKILKHRPLFSFSAAAKATLSVFRYSRQNPLGTRVLAAILLCSTLLAFFATGVQLLLDYKKAISGLELRINQIKDSYLDSIGSSLWSMDEQQTRKQLEGIAKLPDIAYVEIKDPSGKLLMHAGHDMHSQANTLAREMAIRFSDNSSTTDKFPLGTLVVTANLEKVYGDLLNAALVILIAQTIKAMIVAVFALFIFQHLISRHLSAIAAYARGINLNNPDKALRLLRDKPAKPDELDIVVSAFNDMTVSIRRDFKELNQYRTDLESLVANRTDALGAKVAEMKIVIQQLNKEIGERKLAERSARESEERYRQLVEMSPDAIMIEYDGKIAFANRGALKMLGGVTTGELEGKSILEFISPEYREIMQEHTLNPVMHPTEFRSIEGKMTRIDGAVIDVELSRAIIQFGGMPAIQTVAHDITRHKNYEEQLRRQALHDALTNLPNRALLMDRLEQAIALAERERRSVFVVFIDLDRFKYVNDTLGHDAGDVLLKTITARMSSCARKCDTLARIGGDEFVIVFENIVDGKTVSDLLDRIMKSISEPMLLGGQEVAVTCSIGLSVYPDDGKDALTLLKHADTAMYRAKEKGRNGIQRYSADMQVMVNDHLMLESRLRHALERNELLLHYQPLLDLRNGRIIGAEALVRWQHPELGLVPPARFIPLAEETGLIVGIGDWVIRTACMQVKTWHAAGFGSLRVSVNLSTQQLARPQLEDEIAQALRNAGLPPSCLEVEITESMSMNDPQKTVALLTKLRMMGVRIAIDDFGTGYSNLSYLRRFQANRLKLDRSFVRDIAYRADDARLAKAIIGMAHHLHLEVVAEGIEDEHQLALLMKYGCDHMQGFYFSPPLPEDKFMALLHSGRVLDISKVAKHDNMHQEIQAYSI
ncbi:MAG TPA: EAL domain-containing protein [Burkholderiaceae bacterium]|nr:EAL domain-containing protein [Burkholderiaceae bacterium]